MMHQTWQKWQKERLVEMKRAGMGQEDIARETGLSLAQINAINALQRRRAIVALIKRREAIRERRKWWKEEPSPLADKVSTYTDDQGRTITKCPPGYARGLGMDILKILS